MSIGNPVWLAGMAPFGSVSCPVPIVRCRCSDGLCDCSISDVSFRGDGYFCSHDPLWALFVGMAPGSCDMTQDVLRRMALDVISGTAWACDTALSWRSRHHQCNWMLVGVEGV